MYRVWRGAEVGKLTEQLSSYKISYTTSLFVNNST